MREWKGVKLENVADVTSSKRIFYSDYVDTGVPFWRSKEVIEKYNRNEISTDLFISHDRYQEIKNKFGVPQPNDILLTSVGTLGIPYLVLDDAAFYFKDGNLAWIRNINSEVLLPKYFYLWLTSQAGKEALNEISIGSTQEALTISGLKSLTLFLPPIPEQKAIAAVLSSLDDKIDLLHRQNKTLEAMAETLFRQWFVENTREDWEERPLSSIANFLNGLACQKFPPENDVDKLPVLKIKELSGGITETSDWASSNVKPEYIVERGDVIFAWSASLMVKIWDGPKCVLNQHLFKVTSDKFPKWFSLMWCKHHLAEFISISLSHATTMGHIKRGDLDKAMVAVPLTREIEAMSEIMVPLIDKQIAIAAHRQKLEKLRDMLLPKLMNGEVSVK